METIEMLAMLKKNNKLRFVCIQDTSYKDYVFCDRGFIHFERIGEDGKKVSREHSSGRWDGNVHFDDQWQLVREPVSVGEAVTAFKEGKKIKCECPFCWDDGADSCIFPNIRGAICFEGIKSGTWYILDDKE